MDVAYEYEYYENIIKREMYDDGRFSWHLWWMKYYIVIGLVTIARDDIWLTLP